MALTAGIRVCASSYPVPLVQRSLVLPPTPTPQACGGKGFPWLLVLGAITFCSLLNSAHTSANSLVIKFLSVKPFVMCQLFLQRP